MSLFREYIILVPGVAYAVATLFKAWYFMHKGKFSIANVLGTGGMPSGHSALVTSLATAIGIKHGFGEDLFALSLIFAAVVIYDAMNIRFQSGLHAKAINTLSRGDKKFNESLGHLPSEALAGGLLGVIIAIILVA